MKNAVVIDTNIAIKWVITKESGAETAKALLADCIMKKTTMLAPALLLYESSNVLYQKARKQEITFEEAKKAMRSIQRTELVLMFLQESFLATRVMELAKAYSLPATYDLYFLALAESENCELWTADSKMCRAMQGKISWVRDLSEYKTI
jgi:predicted nucleic acid-binding protein